MPTTQGKHLAGGKFTTSHTSVIDAAYAPILAVAQLTCVSKIALGVITAIRNGEPSLKFADTSSGLVAKLRGRSAIQEIRIYCTNREEVKTVMNQAL